jgi:hypothetical protein
MWFRIEKRLVIERLVAQNREVVSFVGVQSMKRISLLSVLLLCHLGSLQGQSTSMDWQRLALQRFPDLGTKDSKLNQLFVQQYSRLKATDANFFSDPMWPMTLATECYDQLNPKQIRPAPMSEAQQAANLQISPSTVSVQSTATNSVMVSGSTKSGTLANQSFSLRPEYQSLGINIRNQSGRRSCVIFGILGCLDFYSAKSGGPTELSEQFAGWADRQITHQWTGANQTYSSEAVIQGLRKYGICSAELMPKEYTDPGVPSQAALDDAKKRTDLTMTPIHQWDPRSIGFNDQEIAAICESISEKQPVVCAVNWVQKGWFRFAEGYVIDPGGVPMSEGGHIVVAVGFEKSPKWEGGGRLEFRNSWGDHWGDSGYAWFSFAYLKKYGREAFSVSGNFKG